MGHARVNITLVRRESDTGLLLWADDEAALPRLLRSAFSRGRWLEGVDLVAPGKDGKPGVASVDGFWLSASRAAAALATVPLGELRGMTASVSVWTLASKWVVEAIARQQLVFTLDPQTDPGRCRARWRVAPVRPEDRSRLAGLAASLPGVARACPVDPKRDKVLGAGAALHEFMDAAVDGLLRASTPETAALPGEGPAWIGRLARALNGPDGEVVLQGLAERNLPSAIGQWVGPAVTLSGTGRPAVGFRLEEPKSGESDWRVTFHLTSASGDVRIPVSELKAGRTGAKEAAARMSRPEETLLEALARCVRVFPPIERCLSEKLPGEVVVDAAEAWLFLTKASIQLERAGYYVEVPAALSKVGRRRVRARMRLGVQPKRSKDAAAAPNGRSGLLAGLIQYQWEASLGDDALTPEEFHKLAASKAPLILHRGHWVAVDPDDVQRLEALMKEGGGSLEAAEALRLALAGQVPVPEAVEVSADVVTDGAVTRALEALKEGIEGELPEMDPPEGLNAELRPYQLRGFRWLYQVNSTGLGACLADDMGLGKTVQVLAEMQQIANEGGPARFLVVCPTSVIGNWRREIRRFCPQMTVVVHHGPSRAGSLKELHRRLDGKDPESPGVLVTSYALARGDQDLLKEITFDIVVLDEAQNIKNPDTAQSQAVRRLAARRRVALTGTPVENRLSELWSIMDFVNPRLLGSRNAFKNTFSVPIERYGDKDAAELLRKVTAPFILRRLKTDPAIVPELPEKSESVRFCPLTLEQASLYQAAIDRGMQEIQGLAQGMQRRGRILKMLTELKQICNHPAQFLRDGNMSPRRSGKLTRFVELLDEILDSQGHALVFTQYREMGEILSAVITERFRMPAPFLHGGLSRNAREEMVAAFQERHGPPVLVVSLRAGGTGLNLVRANHVFHYDRWWNPAVEDQATDRAFRIGQTRDVTVHRMVSQGTLEEHIHQLLEEKRHLADKVIGTGETWLSELDDETLGQLVSLGQDAVLEEEEP